MDALQEAKLASEKDRRQKAHESAVFGRFCSLNPFEIVPGTVTQPPPPAPDIRVDIVGDGLVGFELVNIDDIGYLRGLNLMPESAKVLADFHEGLSELERSEFDAKYKDAMLHVHFVDSAGLRGVRRTLAPLFAALTSLSPAIEGPVLNDGAVRGLQHVYISRGESLSGPEFGTPSSGMIEGLNLDALEAKLGNTYENAGRPVELLAYAMEISRQADDDAINALLDAQMPASSYRKVWIYEHMLGKAVAHSRD
jgi:hypothetical protein